MQAPAATSQLVRRVLTNLNLRMGAAAQKSAEQHPDSEQLWEKDGPWACIGIEICDCKPNALKITTENVAEMREQPQKNHDQSNTREENKCRHSISRLGSISANEKNSPLKDTSMLMAALTRRSFVDQGFEKNDNRKREQQAVPAYEIEWTDLEESRLCDAIRIVAEQQNRRAPSYKEQLTCFVDGQFVNESTREYWRAVSRLVPTRSAMSCFLHYHQSFKAT